MSTSIKFAEYCEKQNGFAQAALLYLMKFAASQQTMVAFPRRRRRLLQKIQHIYPQNPSVMFVQGLLQCRIGNREACVQSFSALLAVHLKKRSVMLAQIEGIFETLFDEERYAESENIARSLVMLEPENPLRYFQLGEALYEPQYYQAALKQYEQVLTVAPESPRTVDRVEAILETLQQPEICTTFWRRLQELHPASPTLKNHLKTNGIAVGAQ